MCLSSEISPRAVALRARQKLWFSLRRRNGPRFRTDRSRLVHQTKKPAILVKSGRLVTDVPPSRWCAGPLLPATLQRLILSVEHGNPGSACYGNAQTRILCPYDLLAACRFRIGTMNALER